MNIDTGLLLTLIITTVAQSGFLWYRLGALANAVKRSCPFGACPLYERAKGEAAPERIPSSQLTGDDK